MNRVVGCHRLYRHPTRSDGHYLCSFRNRKLVFGVTYPVDFNALCVNERKYSRHRTAPFRLDRLRGAVALNDQAWRQMADTSGYALAYLSSRSINVHDKQNSWRLAGPQRRSRPSIRKESGVPHLFAVGLRKVGLGFSSRINFAET